MTILTHFPPSAGWNIEVLGTDLSTKVLARASAGIWLAEKISDVPVDYQRKFLLKGFGPEKGKIKAAEELSGVVRFQRLNLTQEPYPVAGSFDLIFCRNVLIYFQWEMKIKVVDRLGKFLTPNGYLFLGHAESLHGVADKLQSVAPKVFPSPKAPMARSGALCILQRRDNPVRE
jgi:chemotaxis protein methyltransferase CheR